MKQCCYDRRSTNAFGRSYIPIVRKIVFLATQVSVEIDVYDPRKAFLKNKHN